MSALVGTLQLTWWRNSFMELNAHPNVVIFPRGLAVFLLFFEAFSFSLRRGDAFEMAVPMSLNKFYAQAKPHFVPPLCQILGPRGSI